MNFKNIYPFPFKIISSKNKLKSVVSIKYLESAKDWVFITDEKEYISRSSTDNEYTIKTVSEGETYYIPLHVCFPPKSSFAHLDSTWVSQVTSDDPQIYNNDYVLPHKLKKSRKKKRRRIASTDI